MKYFLSIHNSYHKYKTLLSELSIKKKSFYRNNFILKGNPLFIDKLEYNIHSIDLMENNRSLRTSCYVIQDEKIVIIETGASPSNQIILNSLEELGISRESVDGVIVTHIHLDHAGGAGLLMQHLPNAKLYVHSRGAQHLINPDKLISSSRLVYGEKFDKMFSPILAIPEERVVITGEGDRFQLGTNRELLFYDCPGHALHHIFILDTASNGIFTGDTAGILYREIKEHHNFELCLPTSTPTQFDPESMKDSLNRMLQLSPERIYYTHYGISECPVDKINEVINWLDLFSNKSVEQYKKYKSWESVADLLRQEIHKYLYKYGIPTDSPALDSLELDIFLNAQGIESYVKRLERQDKPK